MHIISTPGRRRLTGAGLVVGLAVAGAVYAVPASADGTTDIDATSTYSCGVWLFTDQVPDPPTNPMLQVTVTSEMKVTLPTTVKQGETIPSTSVSITNDMGELLQLAQAVGSYAKGTSPDVAVDVLINNQHVSAPLSDVGADWMPIPTTTPPAPWPVVATGTTSAIDVPQDATGDIVITGPQQFSIISQVSKTSTGDSPTSSAILCTAPAGEDLTIARINVTPVSTPTMTVANPASSVYGKAVTVPASIAVPEGGIAPTGTVLLARPGRPGKPDIGIAQADIDASGNASVTVPGAALPVGTNTVHVTYTGDSNTRPTTSTIFVTKTKATPNLAANIRPAKVVAGETFPTVNVKVTGPGTHLGGQLIVVAQGQTRTARISGDGHGSIQLRSFTAAGPKSIFVSYAGNAYFKPVMARLSLQVAKDSLSTFTAKATSATVNVTRPVLSVKLATDAGPAAGRVVVRSSGNVVGSARVNGTAKITLNRFRSVGTKTLRVRFAGTNGINAKTIMVPLTVKKAR